MTPPSPIADLLMKRWFRRLALSLLTLPYWWSGFAKIADFNGATFEAKGLGFGYAGLVVAATICVQLIGSALVISGRSAWLGAGALAVFTGLATLVAHAFWLVVEPVERAHALNSFLEHVALIAGLVLAAIMVQNDQGHAPVQTRSGERSGS